MACQKYKWQDFFRADIEWQALYHYSIISKTIMQTEGISARARLWYVFQSTHRVNHYIPSLHHSHNGLVHKIIHPLEMSCKYRYYRTRARPSGSPDISKSIGRMAWTNTCINVKRRRRPHKCQTERLTLSQYLLLNNYSGSFGTAGWRLMSTRGPPGIETGADRRRFGRSRGMGKWQSSFSRGGAPPSLQREKFPMHQSGLNGEI